MFNLLLNTAATDWFIYINYTEFSQQTRWITMTGYKARVSKPTKFISVITIFGGKVGRFLSPTVMPTKVCNKVCLYYASSAVMNKNPAEADNL